MLHALLLAAFLSGQSADLATTVWRLQTPAAYREANPLAPHALPGLLAVKASGTLGLARLGWHLQHTQHSRLAALVYLSGAALGTLAAVHNARLPPPGR